MILTDEMDKNKIYFQLVWGILLVMAGVGVFFRIPQVMPKIKTIESFASVIGFIYFCFYLLGFLLILGGARKIYANYKFLKQQQTNDDAG
jgi:hypothetical protein